MKNPSNAVDQVSQNRKKEAIAYLKSSKQTPVTIFEETDPNIASISITQGADPDDRFKYLLSVELENLKPNPENLRGADLAVEIKFNIENLGTGYNTNEEDVSLSDPGTPLPKSYLLQGKRITVIDTDRAVLYEELWPNFAVLTPPPFDITLTLYKKGRKYKGSVEFPEVELTQDLEVLS